MLVEERRETTDVLIVTHPQLIIISVGKLGLSEGFVRPLDNVMEQYNVCPRFPGVSCHHPCGHSNIFLSHQKITISLWTFLLLTLTAIIQTAYVTFTHPSPSNSFNIIVEF